MLPKKLADRRRINAASVMGIECYHRAIKQLWDWCHREGCLQPSSSHFLPTFLPQFEFMELKELNWGFGAIVGEKFKILCKACGFIVSLPKQKLGSNAQKSSIATRKTYWLFTSSNLEASAPVVAKTIIRLKEDIYAPWTTWLLRCMSHQIAWWCTMSQRDGEISASNATKLSLPWSVPPAGTST